MEHIKVVHTNCQRNYCHICEGGLYECEVCQLVEGCLTTECPGVPSYAEYGETVYNGWIDFVGGKWENTASPHSPHGHRIGVKDETKS